MSATLAHGLECPRRVAALTRTLVRLLAGGALIGMDAGCSWSNAPLQVVAQAVRRDRVVATIAGQPDNWRVVGFSPEGPTPYALHQIRHGKGVLSDAGEALSQEYPISELNYHGVNLIHGRLPELARLADAAKPFYEWLEQLAQTQVRNRLSLSDNLHAMTELDLKKLILAAYTSPDNGTLPALFDGIGRQYAHRKAVYYFLAWLIRDAPQQRLAPMLARAQANARHETSLSIEAGALAKLLVAYRGVLGTFDWPAVREVVMDRLEGSRRSIRGRESEVVVRTATTVALQAYYSNRHSYGRFGGINVAGGEVRIEGETFDVSVDLLSYNKEVEERILMPVKTRETEGGGHSHLFTRDVEAAIAAARRGGEGNWVAVWIIAQNWSARQTAHVAALCDFTVALAMDPSNFRTVDPDTQDRLNGFIAGVLDGTLSHKDALS